MRHISKTFSGVALLLLIGCSSTDTREPPPAYTADAKFLFSVAIKPSLRKITDEDGDKLRSLSKLGDNCMTLYNRERLAAYLTNELAYAGLFTRVIPASDAPLAQSRTTDTVEATAASETGAPKINIRAPDLSLEVDLLCSGLGAVVIEEGEITEGTPFGEGSNAVFPCVLSTVAWLFTGPLSWLIPDREFGDPEAEDPEAEGVTAPQLQIKSVLDGADDPDPFNSNKITVSDYREFQVPQEKIDVRFVDRHDLRIAWLWNIVLPPWTPPSLISPSPEDLNESLAEAALLSISENLKRTLRETFGQRLVRNSRALLFVATDDKYPYLLLAEDSAYAELLEEGAAPKSALGILEELDETKNPGIIQRMQRQAQTALAVGGAEDISRFNRTYRVKLEEIKATSPWVKLVIYGRNKNDPLGSWTLAVQRN